jgi:hypothetical protein
MELPRTRSAARRLASENQPDLPLFAQPAPFLVGIAERLSSNQPHAAQETQKKTQNSKAHTKRKLWKWTKADDKLDGQLPSDKEFAENYDDAMNFHMSITMEENHALLQEDSRELKDKDPEAIAAVGTRKPLRIRDMLWMRFKFERCRIAPQKPILHPPTIFAWRGWEPPPFRPQETIESILSGPLPPEPPQTLRLPPAGPVKMPGLSHASLPMTFGPSSFTQGPLPLAEGQGKLDWSSPTAVTPQALSNSGTFPTSSFQSLLQHPHSAQEPAEVSEAQSENSDESNTESNAEPRSVENTEVKTPEKKPHKSTEKERDLFERLNGPDGIVNPNGPCKYCRDSGKECRVMASEVNMAPQDRQFLRCNHCCRRKAGAEACNINIEEAKRRGDERTAKSEAAKAKREAALAKREAAEARREAKKAEQKLKQEAKGSKKRPSPSSSVVSDEQSPTKRSRTSTATSNASEDEAKTEESTQEQSPGR